MAHFKNFSELYSFMRSKPVEPKKREKPAEKPVKAEQEKPEKAEKKAKEPKKDDVLQAD